MKHASSSARNRSEDDIGNDELIDGYDLETLKQMISDGEKSGPHPDFNLRDFIETMKKNR